MDPDYFKQYYTLEREHWWYMARIKILASFVKLHLFKGEPLKILNVGVATGATSEMLLQFGTVTSIEYDKACIDFVNNNTSIKVQQGSITEIDFEDNTFDLVCAFDVIEHVENDQKAASELLRVCSKKGYVFVTTPAYQFLWSEHDVVNHHYKRYTLGGFKKLFEKDLYNIVKQTYFNTFLFPPIALLRLALWPFQKNKNVTNEPRETDATRFNSSAVNKVLYNLFLFEKSFLSKISFPFGVSIALLLRKK